MISLGRILNVSSDNFLATCILQLPCLNHIYIPELIEKLR